MDSIINYTLEEIQDTLLRLRPLFFVARLIDPKNTAVITFGPGGEPHSEPYSCYKVWNRSGRCENCTSMACCIDRIEKSKYEILENSVFYIISRPIFVTAPGGGYLLALEMVSHVTDEVMLDNFGRQSIASLITRTKQQMYEDSLTHVYNRRFFDEFKYLYHGNDGLALRLAFIVADIKRFKSINDRYGHVAGDRVLMGVAGALRENVRKSDSVIRMGGDEFLLVLSGAEEAEVVKKIRVLKEKVAQLVFPEGFQVTVDCGYSMSDQFMPNQAFAEEMATRADRAMYLDKMGKSEDN